MPKELYALDRILLRWGVNDSLDVNSTPTSLNWVTVGISVPLIEKEELLFL